MRIKPEYKIRKIAGRNIVIIQGEYDADMTKMISLNDTAAWLWEQLAGRDFTAGDAAELLLSRFDLGSGRAEADARKWMETLAQCNALE